MQDRPETQATKSVMICSDKENVNGGRKRSTLVLGESETPRLSSKVAPDIAR